MDPKPTLVAASAQADLLDYLERVLGRDFLVQRAGSAKEALVLLEAEGPAVLLADERLPDRSGLELLGEAHGLAPETARVILVGFARLPEICEAARRGLAHAYLVKPLDFKRLKGAIAEARARLELGDWKV
ncbi:MAG: response regulator [Polyangia bacterium]|jgi:DNA-binding NtrC family response regulator|nr:response regulator [Polyangia bacterium]